MKNIIKDIIFIFIFILLFSICNRVFVLKGNTYGSDVTSFYHEKKNSLDIIFFGSSHSYATFSPDVIEENTDLKSYNFATQQQPIYITYYYMKEALKYQKPKYFVLETRMFSVNDEYTTEGVIRDALDKMKMSPNKIDAINTSVKEKSDRTSYYINMIKYHSRYNSLTKTDLKAAISNVGINNRGFKDLPVNEEVEIDNSDIINITETLQISDKNLEYLNKIVALANDNHIELIFVKSPCKITEKEQKNYNWVKQYAKENDIDYIDYNEQFKELNLNVGDFYDTGHLSITGAQKVSLQFSNYIRVRYLDD